MHLLEIIDIQNFRSCQKTRLTLDAFTPLVGYNNGGKTNILAAIKWLLQYTLLSSSDFCDESKPVMVCGKIAGITQQLLERLHEKHRTKMEPLCSNEVLWIRRIQPTPIAAKKDIMFQIASPFNAQQEPDDETWQKSPTGIEAAIEQLFPNPIQIGAMEDVAEDVAKSKASNTIGKLIAQIMTPIVEKHGGDIRKGLEKIRKLLTADGEERAQELKDFDKGANEKLLDLFPDVTIKAHVPVPESQDLFKRGTIQVYEQGQAAGRDFQTMGHGAQRCIQMALVRHLAESSPGREEEGSRTLLLVDEPELYLHPQGIEQTRCALKALSDQAYQVVFATHSPLMIAPDDIPRTLIVRKTVAEGTHTPGRLQDAVRNAIKDAQAQTRILWRFGNAREVLFSDHVLVAEGPTEKRLLPAVFERLRERSLGAAKIGLVDVGGAAGIPNCLKILKAMAVEAKAVADLDFAFHPAVEGRIIAEDDEDLEAAKTVFKKLAEQKGFPLADDGFPCKGGALGPDKAFALFAATEEGEALIASLHAKLLERDIWLWPKGAIEQQLGIKDKGEEARISYEMALRDRNTPLPFAEASVSDFLDWLDPPAA